MTPQFIPQHAGVGDVGSALIDWKFLELTFDGTNLGKLLQ